MKLEVGQFARLKSGYIVKILNVKDDWIETDTRFIMRTFPQDFAKTSYNIIDILEVGDILLLFDKEYEEKYKAEVVTDQDNFKSIINYEQDTLLSLEYELITNEHIELLEILTKEQFEQMAYKAEE